MSDRRARAFWVVGPSKGEIREESLPAAGPDEILVHTLFSGISRGTEALVYRGEVPVSEWARMRAPFQHGSFPAPVKYGYASVGRVDAGPESLRGRTVFVLHPHQTAFVVPVSAAFAVPDAVPARRAILAANLETAINITWDADLRIGDRVAVVGAGTVGALTAWLAGRVPGCSVELVDVNPARASLARALGVGFALPATARPAADIVIHASGTAEGLAQALQLANVEAVVVEASWYGSRAVTASLGGAFHSQRLTLRSSQVGRIPPVQQARWTTRRRLELALDLLADPALDALVRDGSPFDALPSTMERLARDPGDTLCHCVEY